MCSRMIRVLAVSVTASALPALAVAQGVPRTTETFWTVEAGAEYTDNVGRASEDEQSETVGTGTIAFGLATVRRRLDADITGRLEYREYFDSAFDSEIVGGVRGAVLFTLIPERFTWVVTDNFGQISNDRRLVDNPDNRRDINYFSTGPDVTLPLGQRTFVQVSGRYSDTYYEGESTDSTMLTGSLALIRQLSTFTSISLNGSSSDVDYDDELIQDYRIDQAFLRWSTVNERSSFVLDGGYNQVDDGTNSSGGVLARLELSQSVAARSRIGLNVGTEFVTTGLGFRRVQEITGVDPGTGDAIATRDAYQMDYAYLTWTTDRVRSSFSVTLSARSESHEVETLDDRDLYGAALRLSRHLTPRLDGSLTASYTKEELVNENFSFDEWHVSVGLSWLVGPSLSVRLRLEHFEGSSDGGVREFDENRAYLGLAYTRRR